MIAAAVHPPTVSDLQGLKGRRQIVTMHVESADEAEAAAAAGIEMFTCESDATFPRVRAAAPGVFMQVGIAQGVLVGDETAIREAFRAMDDPTLAQSGREVSVRFGAVAGAE